LVISKLLVDAHKLHELGILMHCFFILQFNYHEYLCILVSTIMVCQYSTVSVLIMFIPYNINTVTHNNLYNNLSTDYSTDFYHTQPATAKRA